MAVLLAEEVDLDVGAGMDTLAVAFESGLYRAKFSATSGDDWTGFARVDHPQAKRLRFSGDLYLRADNGSPGATIAVFPRKNTRLHFASIAARQNELDPLVVDFESTVRDGQLALWCQPHGVTFSPLAIAPLAEQWRLVLGHPADGAFPGRIVSDGEDVVAQGELRRLFEPVRRCTIRIICHPDSEMPLTNGSDTTLQSVFQGAGWDVRLLFENMLSEHRLQRRWSNAELLSILPQYVDDSAIEKDWLALLFCVPQLADTTRGVMFDFGNTALNQVPRQACAIASHWTLPDESIWKSGRGQRFGTVSSLYFRTAIHELLHVFSIGHPSNVGEVSFRQTTEPLMALITDFPDGVPRTLSSDEIQLLRHLPDIVARPGGLTQESDGAEDCATSRVSRTVRMTIEPLCQEFPVGSPVRLRIVCRNRGNRGVRIPSEIGFSAGTLHVSMQAPSGHVHNVEANINYDCTAGTRILLPGERCEAGVTLFGGSRGPMFTEVGSFRIAISISAPTILRIEGKTVVKIGQLRTRRRSSLIRRVLQNGRMQILLVTGKPDRNLLKLLSAILRDRLLGPHFRYLAVKPFGRQHFEKQPRLTEMAKLVSGDVIMTAQELLRAAEMLLVAVRTNPRAKESARRLHSAFQKDAKKIRMLGVTRARIRHVLKNVMAAFQA
jgi:hypothetical protein